MTGARRGAAAAVSLTILALAGCEGPPAGTAARGEMLYGYCVQCHGAEGAGDEAVRVPPIAGLPSWYVESQLLKFKSGARGAHADDEAGLRMRPMARALRDESEVKDVAAYVAALEPAAHATTAAQGDAARGAATYAVCVACHQADASGNQGLSAPPLAGAPDWYLLSQLSKFRNGARGAIASDSTGATMRAIALTLPDEQALRDVVAHIASLKNGAR